MDLVCILLMWPHYFISRNPSFKAPQQDEYYGGSLLKLFSDVKLNICGRLFTASLSLSSERRTLFDHIFILDLMRPPGGQLCLCLCLT